MEPSAQNPVPEGNTDKFGIVASTICAIHCLVCALLPFAFVGLGLGFLMSHEVEWALTMGAIAFGTVALFQGWRVHRSLLPAGFLIAGIIGLLTSRVIEMNSGHHDHHDEHHTEHHDEHHDEHQHEKSTHTEEKSVNAMQNHDSHGEDNHNDEHSHAEEEGSAHSLGGLIGLFGGLLLVFGHVFNIRASRQCRKECCDEPVQNA